MSHVISAQPSATSPYQPTAVQEGNGAADNTPRIHRIDSEHAQEDCCLNPSGRKGCCRLLCTPLFMCYNVLAACTDSCCNCCADCLNDCCEDKPQDRRKQTQRHYISRYKNSGSNNWALTSLEVDLMNSGFNETDQGLMNNTSDDYVGSGTHHFSGHHNSSTHHSSSHHDSGTHHSSSHHDSGTHHSSSHHDSGTHHSSSHHDSGTHHSSSHHDSSTHHATCHSSGGGFDSGGGCDSGGGDTGGGCDSGGGGCDD